MVDLTTLSGLPLKFDDISEKFQYGAGVTYNACNRIPLVSMLPGLLNKSLRYPEIVYLEHKNIHNEKDNGLFEQGKFNYDMLMLPSGVMGVEFIRTHVFYNEVVTPDQPGLSEIVEVLSGGLTVLLQKNTPRVDKWEFGTAVSEGLVVKLNRGEKFSIPRGYFYTFINNRAKPVVFSRFYIKGCACDYSTQLKEQGLAYFAIRKNAKQEIVLNPRYRDIPKIKKTNPNVITNKIKFELNPGPLYQQVVAQAPSLLAWF